MSSDEMFPLVDPSGDVIGKATRKECHNGSKLLHPVVHLHVVGPNGTLYLQKRSMDKDIQPGKWDTAVGGHVDYGETVDVALRREAREELGLKGFDPVKLEPYIHESDVERELINPYVVYNTGDLYLVPDPVEISEGRYWTQQEIESNIGVGVFTPNFESEYLLIKDYIK